MFAAHSGRVAYPTRPTPSAQIHVLNPETLNPMSPQTRNPVSPQTLNPMSR